jgi:hypothetical protein
MSMHNSNLNSQTAWINAFVKWLEDRISDGYEPYYINFLFHPISGSLSAVISTMHKGIENGFYSRFCTRFVRRPRSPLAMSQMPQLWVFPDRPVAKRAAKKVGVSFLTRNDNGLHYNGFLMIPPKSRFKECPIEHIRQNQEKYAQRGIERIHVRDVYNVGGLADYALKTIKWGRADEADILILPKTWDEMPAKRPALGPRDRTIRDIKSALNVSDEVAEEIYNARGGDSEFKAGIRFGMSL